MSKNWTVDEVELLFSERVGKNFASTEEGQKHLNRIAKAITNESLDKRVKTQRETLAEAAFNKELAKVAAKSPGEVTDFIAGKGAWIEKHIARRYGTDED